MLFCHCLWRWVNKIRFGMLLLYVYLHMHVWLKALGEDTWLVSCIGSDYMFGNGEKVQFIATRG